MISKIATLSAKLRDSGTPVSVRSTQSAVKIHMEFGETDRQLLKTALMAVYVKDRYDIPKFNKIFEEVFKVQVEKEVAKEDQRGTAYRGKGPKSNKYIIKKQQNSFAKANKEKIEDNKPTVKQGNKEPDDNLVFL